MFLANTGHLTVSNDFGGNDAGRPILNHSFHDVFRVDSIFLIVRL